MNIPNALSLFRIGLTPLFVGFYMQGRTAAALALLGLSAVSDVLDGAIARRFDMETRLGRILDPIGDKLFQGAMMLCAATKESGVWLLLGLHLGRESLTALLGLTVLRRRGIIIHAHWYGKLCTVIIYALMLSIIALPKLSRAGIRLGIGLCGGMMLLCLLLYALEFARLLRGRERA